MDFHDTPLPAGRTLPVNGSAVRQFRLDRSWSTSQLADKALCSDKTITRIEAGQPAYSATVVKVAKALGVNARRLLLDPHPQGTPSTTVSPLSTPSEKPGTITFRFQIDFSFDQFDETADLDRVMKVTRTIIRNTGEILIQSVDKSSVAITVELDDDDALRFLRAFCMGKLEALSITRAELPPDRYGLGLWKILFESYVSVKVFAGKRLNAIDMDVAGRRIHELLYEQEAGMSSPSMYSVETRFNLLFLSQIMVMLMQFRSYGLEMTFDAIGTLILTRTPPQPIDDN